MRKNINKLSAFLGLLVLAVMALCICLMPMLVTLPREELVENVILNEKFRIQATGIVVMLIILFAFIRMLWVFVRSSANNIKYGKDELFYGIDRWNSIRKDNRFYYDMGIQTINYLYRKNGGVHLLVQNSEGDRLQKRKQYLEGQLEVWGEFHQCILAIAQSIIAALIVDSFPGDNWLISAILGAIIILSILAMPLAKYSGRLPLPSKFERAILEYELTCLNKYIEKYHDLLVVPEDRAMELQTYQVAILELTKLLHSAKKKEKQKIRHDIECIEGLNLINYNQTNSHRVTINIGGQQCCLVYKKAEGLSNNYVGPYNLINDDYAKLYDILQEYRMFVWFDDIK